MSATSPRQRVSAEERRSALIDAAIVEFAHGGLHGTPVDRIARRVGVAQPYVFSLFASKKELFLAAVERAFAELAALFDRVAAEFDPDAVPPDYDVLNAVGEAYVAMVSERRELLMLQHQAYAACDEDEIRARVRAAYAGLVARAQAISGADPERVDEFFRYGMWLNVAAAMGVEDLSTGCEWMQRAGA